MFDEPSRRDLEFLDAAAVAERQDALLRDHIRYVAKHSPFYRRLFASMDVAPDEIRSVADLSRLPLTAKSDLAEHEDEFLCADPADIVDMCLTSGTTGRAVAMLQTDQDLERVGFNEEISFRAAGISSNDVVLISASIDRCFMAGLAYFLGLRRIGATAIRGGSGSIAALEELTIQHGPSAIVGVPTLLLNLGRRLEARGIAPDSLGVERLVCIGEPVRNADLSLSMLGARLADNWGAQVYGTYASTEMATAFCDCEAGNGGHLHPDLIVLEAVDDAGRPVEPGEPGELVATPLQVTGMPLVRFRTGDIARLDVEPCACGRTSPRVGPIIGRKSQMLKYRGTTVYPASIFTVLQEIEDVTGYYLEVFDDFELADRIRVVVGTRNADLHSDHVAETLAARLRVKPEVVVTTPEAVQDKITQPGKRKPVTFFDHRRTPPP